MKPAKESTQQPRETATIQLDRQLTLARISPCGKLLVAGGYDAVLRRFDISGEQPQELPPLAGHHGWVTGLEFLPGGNLFFSSDSWGGLQAWKYNGTEAELAWRQEQAHDGWIRALSLCEDGKLLVTAGRDQIVRVWSAEKGEKLHELTGHQHDVYSAAVHPSGTAAVSADLMGNLKHWSLAEGKCVREVQVAAMHFYDRDQDVAGLRILKFHDSGKKLLCAGADPTRAGRSYAIPTLRLLDWDTLEEDQVLHFGPDKNGFVFDVHWHPDGYFMLVTSGPPGAGQFLFARPGEEEPFFLSAKMYNCHSLAVHLPSRRLAVSATNRGSQGNGAVLDKEGNYKGNSSPLHFFELASKEGEKDA